MVVGKKDCRLYNGTDRRMAEEDTPSQDGRGWHPPLQSTSGQYASYWNAFSI